MQWKADPTAVTLDASTARRGLARDDALPGAFCVEVGRRILLAQLQFGEWIVRRVEKVVLDRDRSLSRRVTIEFAVRADAPTFVAVDGRLLRLVPLSMMRRRTLVNLDIVDESGRTVPMPGIRLTQQLDESVLLASIAAAHPQIAATEECRRWVHQAIAGDRDQVLDAYARFDHEEGSAFLDELRSDDLVVATVNRFRTNFTLYLFVPDDVEDTYHGQGCRMIRMSFDEPINWRYQRPRLRRAGARRDVWLYRAGQPRGGQLRRGLAALGITPIRIRLQVPGAAEAASYHFEMTAPQGVQIVGATLLAGRPNDSGREQTVDAVVGHVTTVGLHGLEIPSVALCRVQIDLRPPARGWLATMLTACLAVSAVLGSVAYQWWGGDPGWDKDQITNIIVLLVATSAGVTTLVAQRHGADVASRFVTGARTLGTFAMALPVAISGLLVYAGLAPGQVHSSAERWAILVLCWASFIPLLAIALAWSGSVRADRKSELKSPWDMTDHRRDPGRPRPRPRTPRPYESWLAEYNFDTAAVGVQSAEGWHEVYAWDDRKQERAVRSLAPDWDFPVGKCAGLGGNCARRNACPDTIEAAGARP